MHYHKCSLGKDKILHEFGCDRKMRYGMWERGTIFYRNGVQRLLRTGFHFFFLVSRMWEKNAVGTGTKYELMMKGLLLVQS